MGGDCFMKGRFLRSQKTHASHSTDNHKKKLSKYWIGIAAGCVGAIGIFSAIMIPTLSKPSSKNVLPDWFYSSMSKGIAKISGWEELDLPGKYPDLLVGEELFTPTHDTIPEEEVGDFLFETTLTGYDPTDPAYYTDRENAKSCTTGADVYTVKGMEPDYLVAVQYEGEDGFYTYFPNAYVPETLGEFATNLHLKENLKIESIVYEAENGKQNYTIADSSALWDIVFANTSAQYSDPNDTKIFSQFHSDLSIKVSMEIVAEPSASISISKNGYLFTNLYKTGKLFYIGEENAAAIIQYVLDNGQVKE